MPPPRDERGAVDVVALGNPHLSLGEVAELRRLVGEAGADARKHPDVRTLSFSSRSPLSHADQAHLLSSAIDKSLGDKKERHSFDLEAGGVTFKSMNAIGG